jgi:hypothetical protein
VLDTSLWSPVAVASSREQALLPELCIGVEGESEGLLVDPAQEADFDSRGEFHVDLIKAREKLEVHLGLWPEDYLSFLVQAAYGLGARKLKLSSTWHSLVWEFDGRCLSPPELQSLFPLDGSAGPGGEVLARLHTAFFLLTRGRYARARFTSGIGDQGCTVEWSARGHHVKGHARRDSVWSHRLELHLPLQGLNLRWFLTRRSALFTLPEYAPLRPRLAGSPVQVQVPWALPVPATEESLFAVHLRGPYEAPAESAAGAAAVFDYPSEGDYSAWFLARKNATGCRCVAWALGYEGPEWNSGFLWLYSDQLRTDLSQRQLVRGALLESLLAKVEQRLDELLPQIWCEGKLGTESRPWALLALGRYLERGGRLGKALTGLPLFATVQHGLISLQRLDGIYADQGEVLHFCTAPPAELPAEAPPILLLEPDIASIVQKRYHNVREAAGLLQDLQVRQLQKEQWLSRPQESLAVEEAAHRLDLAGILPGSGWEGEVALTPAPAQARVDVFIERRWLAAVPLPSRFPLGYLARVQHPDLPVNRAWTEPDRSHQLWDGLLDRLWQHLPGWLATVCLEDPSEWLRQRAYDTMLAHEQSQPLEDLALVPAGGGRMASLSTCRRALEDQKLHLWIWDGWVPKDRGWRLLHKLAGHDELFRWWSVRLEGCYREFQRWSQAAPQPVVLPHPHELVCVLDLPDGRGQVGMRPLPLTGVELLAFRGQRAVGQQTLPGLVYSLDGLPDGLQVAVEHQDFVPQCSVYEIDVQSPSWREALGWIRSVLPGLVQAVLQSRYAEKVALAVRLLGWLPRELWPAPENGPEFCKRLDGTAVHLGEALRQLGGAVPIPVLVEPGELRALPEFGHVWLLSQFVRAEIAAVWGPSQLVDCQEDYLAAWLALEHGQAQPEPALLPSGGWLARAALRLEGAEGEVGLASRKGAGNHCHLRLLRRGRMLFEHAVPLLARPEVESRYALHCVLDWPDAPVVGSFGQLVETPQGALLLGELLPRWRLFGFDPPLLEEREYLWERLAFEAGAQGNANVGFTLELDEVRQRLLEVPVFALEGKLRTLAQLLAYVEAEGRLGYILGEPIGTGGGPILYLSARELAWVKLLLRNTQLANLSHLRGALRKQEERAQAPRLAELPLPDLDYVLSGGAQNVRWGLQREMNVMSRVVVLRQMQEVEVLTFDWRYQVQASLNVDELQLNSDGSVRRDAPLQNRVDALRAEVQERILREAPPGFRLELAFRTWGLQEDWARQLQAQPLLSDPRGEQLSVQQWVAAWSQEQTLPYLLPEDTSHLELLPPGPVALLQAAQVAAAASTLPASNYRTALRDAWALSRQPPHPSPAGSTFQHASPGARIWADLAWTEQTLRFVWRGRCLHQETRSAWPGYELELDWTDRLLGQPLPTWTDVTSLLAPYRAFLQNLLLKPDLLEESREMWELIPVPARLDATPVLLDPSEEDLRALLGRRKAEWHIRERDRFTALQHVCQRWWSVPVRVDVHLDDTAPARWQEDEGARTLWFNPEHRWFRGQPTEVIALRLTFWLQADAQTPSPEAARLRAEVVKELGMLREEGK